MNGGVFRLPEMGIRLDFIDRVKKSWFEDESFARLAGRPPKMKERLYKPTGSPLYHSADHVVFKRKEPDFYNGSHALAIVEGAKANKKLLRKTFSEQQAALNLVALARTMPGYVADPLADLTNQLISEAPDNATISYQQGEKGALLQLQELVQRRLNILDGIPMPLPPPAQQLQYAPPAPVQQQPTLKPKPMYQPIQPAPYPQPTQMQNASTPYTAGSMGGTNLNGYVPSPRPLMQRNYESYGANSQSQVSTPGGYQGPGQGHTQSQGSGYGAGAGLGQVAVNVAATGQQSPQQQQQNTFNAALDPRLFGSGSVIAMGLGFGEDDGDVGNDADVEMDGN